MQAQELIDSTTRNAVFVEGLKTGEVNQFAAFLRRMDATLRDQLTKNDLTDFSRKRLESLVARTEKQLEKIFDEHYDELAGHLTEFGEYEASFEASNIDNALINYTSAIPAARQIRAAVFTNPLSVEGPYQGKLLEPFIRDLHKTEVKRLSGTIRHGFATGQTNFQILQSIRGTKKLGYKDGLLKTVDRNISSVIRTGVQHTANTARAETWKENPKVVKGYRWLATLDGRTSTICRSLDDQVFKVDKGPIPPAHINCRSTTVAELDERYASLMEGSKRASKDGPVANESYYSWLKRQPGAFQDQVLGPVRGKLLRYGGLSAERFARLNLGKNFKPLSLSDMRKVEPLAFKKAFGGDGTPKVKPRRGINTRASKVSAKRWHKSSFSGSPEWVSKYSSQFDINVTNERQGAYAYGGVQINMPENYRPGSKTSQTVWRHEFGHIIDTRIDGNYRYVSSSPDFKAALTADAENLKMVKGVGRRKSQMQIFKGEKKRLYGEAEEAIYNAGSAKARTRELKRIAAEAGIDYDKFKSLARKSGTVLDDGMTEAAQVRLAKMMRAVELGDGEGFIEFAALVREGDYLARKSAFYKDGSFASLSDLFGATTRNKVANYHGGFPGHPNSYYAARSEAGPTEAFANLTSLAGHPDGYWWELVKRFVPETAREYEKVMK